MLHAAVTDFSYEGARAAYAQWLALKGDDTRADAVRATIEAFHTLDASPLNDLRVDLCWGRMIAIPLLSVLARARTDHDADGLRLLRDLVFPRIRAALSLSYSPCKREPEIGSSYLWGLPDIPDGETWPTVSSLSDWYRAKEKLPQYQHAAFLGQIAFADLHTTVLGQELPTDGGFAAFAITEVEQLGIVETLVRTWNRKARLKRRAAPPDLLEDRLGDSTNSPLPPHRIALEEVLSLPDATDGPFAREIPNCKYGEVYYELYRSLMDGCGGDALGFGGYLRGTSGTDPSPDANCLRFAVLRATPEAGLLHFAIPAADLTGRLNGVKYVWNDWDS